MSPKGGTDESDRGAHPARDPGADRTADRQRTDRPKLVAMGGQPELRVGFITFNGHQIVDVHDMDLSRPITSEDAINKIPGVVENGLFARHPADVLVLGTQKGVEVLKIR